MHRSRSARLMVRWLVALPLAAALLNGSVLRVTHHHHQHSGHPQHSGRSATVGYDVESPAHAAVTGGHLHAGSCPVHGHLLGVGSTTPADQEPAEPVDAEYCAVCHYLAQVAEMWIGPAPQAVELCALNPPAADLPVPRATSWSVYSTRAPPV